MAVLFSALSVVIASGQSFQNPRAIHIEGPSPIALPADMNNDGLPDLVVQTGDTVTPSTIEVLLADAAGNYTASAHIDLPGWIPFPCVAADINGDKKMDLVCASGTPGGGEANVTVYLGNGDGTLQAPISTDLGYIGIPNALLDVIAVADFNNDGHLDAIVTTGPAGAYAAFSFTLLGDGTGHFAVSQFQGGLNSGHATVVDVNGDGIPDLLIGTGPIVYIGKGDGTFGTQFWYQFGKCIFADFEKTGKLAAACNAGGGVLQFLHENADGSFNAGSPITSVSLPATTQFLEPLQAIDLNGDGILDLVISTGDGLQVMLGKPGLSFGAPVPYLAGSTAGLSAVAGFLTDMDGDGHPDFVTTGPETVYISYGTAAGAFDAPVLTQSGTNFYSAIAADFDGDGLADVLTFGPTGFNLQHGNGDGTFSQPKSVSLPTGYSIPPSPSINDFLVGDFNGDGNKDFLVPIGIFSDNLLFPGNGNGTFAPAIVIPSLPSTLLSNGEPVIADVNHDGKDDIVQVEQTAINSYLSQGDGNFRLVSSSFVNDGNKNTAIALADFNGDGNRDAIIFFADHAIVLTGNGDGSFSSTATTLTIPSVDGISLITNINPLLAVGDFDGDGKQDVALIGSYFNNTPDLYLGGNSGGRYSDAVWVYYGNGDTTFSQPLSAGIFYDHFFSSLTAAALKPGTPSDLFVVEGNSVGQPVASALALLSSHSDRTFGAPLYFLGGESVGSFQLADFNHDGKLDVFVSNAMSWGSSAPDGVFAVLVNQPVRVKGSIITSPQPSLAGKPYTIATTLVSFQSEVGAITGELSFTLDGAPIASATLNNNVASQVISTNLTGGDHQITATWAGDETFAPVSVNAVQHVMDYAITADSSVSIQTGHTGSIGFHLKSIDGFGDTLTLSCGDLPTYAACTFTNSGPSLSSGQTIDATVTVGTAKTTTQSRLSVGYMPLSLVIVVPGLFLLLRRRIPPAMLLVLASLSLLTAGGCGGGGSSSGGGGGTTTPTSTPPGTYRISIIASGKNTQLLRTATVNLTITP